MTCIFCTLAPDQIIESNAHAFAIHDRFPVSPGHTLVISRRHVASFFELDDTERLAMLALVETARHRLAREHHPDAYNIGINDGRAAGQTIAHVHLHLIPRFAGDCSDPRGGVRWIYPERARYWTD